jgi:hypothetical protein
MNDSKYIQQLINTHKITSIILPLIEAVEINKRSGGIEKISAPDLLKEVIHTGTKLYEDLLDVEKTEIVETGVVLDKLFVALAKCMRNNIVLYNNPSLALARDELLEVFKENSHFLQRYQNEQEKKVNELEQGVDTIHPTSNVDKWHVYGYIITAITNVFMPIWLFHTNLYTSGYIDETGMAQYNKRVTKDVLTLIDKMVERISIKQGGMDAFFKVNSFFVCCDMVSHVLKDYQSKLIKNQSSLKGYIEDPSAYIKKLLPPLYANFTVLNATAEEVINDLMESGIEL